MSTLTGKRPDVNDLVRELAGMRGSWKTVESRAIEIGRALGEVYGDQFVAAWNWRGLRAAFYEYGGTRRLELELEYAWDGIGDWQA